MDVHFAFHNLPEIEPRFRVTRMVTRLVSRVAT